MTLGEQVHDATDLGDRVYRDGRSLDDLANLDLGVSLRYDIPALLVVRIWVHHGPDQGVSLLVAQLTGRHLQPSFQLLN